ncbi:unnamed protein product [Oreochromis niloticus]|nr:unnamed protein product [Mustela putorius furo]
MAAEIYIAWTCLVAFVVCADQKSIRAESGQDITLPCRAPNNNIISVEWSRADLGDEYVFLYKDKSVVLDQQHPSFKNRVDLQDRQMKDGDVSLILKNVTINDAGTYECGVQREGDGLKPISIIILRVHPPGQTGGHTEDGSVGLKVGLSVSAVLLVVAVVGFLIYRKLETKSQDQPPAELQAV